MNKFKFGDKVMIKTMNQEGTILGWEHKVINGIDCGYTYTVKTFIKDDIPIIGTAREKDLESKIPTPQEVLDVVDEIGIDNLINCFEKENDPMGKAKFKIGDKVRVKSYDKAWTIINITVLFVKGEQETYYYTLQYEDSMFTYTFDDVPEEHLELIDDDIAIKFKNGSYIKVMPVEDKCSCDCCGHDVCEDSDYNEDFENELDDDEIEDYEYNKSCESLDNDKKFNLGNLAQSPTYPQIRDYYYDEKTATTVIKWTDGTTTKVKAAEGDTPDQHTGFANAVAKKYFGNGNIFAREAKWWIVDEPKYRAMEEKFCKEYDAEKVRKEEKRRANREKRIIKAKALARKREYEARKLAAEKYGVPMEWQDTDA